jgi:hypothetical protein
VDILIQQIPIKRPLCPGHKRCKEHSVRSSADEKLTVNQERQMSK